MVHLVSKGSLYYVVDVAANHEILKTSQSKGLTTRKGALKNIRASLKLYGGTGVTVQDNTSDIPKLLHITSDSVSQVQSKAGKKFIYPVRKSPGSKARK